jgi:predicted dehydrogenase
MIRRDFHRLAASVALAAAARGSAADGPPKPRIKVGQIGVGHAHATKLAVYRRSPDYEVVGVVEPDEALRKKVEADPAYRDLPWLTREQLLNTSGLRAVLVETRVRDLLANAEACVAAGVHVHLDKPAGESLPHLRKVFDLAAKAKVIVQMGYMFRYNPAVVLLREVLAKGWLGDVAEVSAGMGKVVGPADRKDLAAYPGGILFELGCHVLDLVVGILGEPRAVTGHGRHVAKTDDGLVDAQLAVLDYPTAVATVRASAVDADGFARRHLTVSGTGGTFHVQPLDSPAVRLTLDAARGPYKKGPQDVPMPRYERYFGDAADMAAVIRGEKPFAFPPGHDLAVQATLLKACGLPTDR